MRAVALAVAALFAAGAASAADPHVYTNEDLDAMFGPSAPEAAAPARAVSDEDTRWVEEFLARHHARIERIRRPETPQARHEERPATRRIPIGDKFSYTPELDAPRWSPGTPHRESGACLLDSRLEPGDPCYAVWRVMLPRPRGPARSR